MQKIYLTGPDGAQWITAPDDRQLIADAFMDGATGPVADDGGIIEDNDGTCGLTDTANGGIYRLMADDGGPVARPLPARAWVEVDDANPCWPGLAKLAAKYPPPAPAVYDLADDAAPADRPARFDADYGA